MGESTRKKVTDLREEAAEGVKKAHRLHERADALHHEADKVHRKAESMHQEITAMRERATSTRKAAQSASQKGGAPKKRAPFDLPTD